MFLSFFSPSASYFDEQVRKKKHFVIGLFVSLFLSLSFSLSHTMAAGSDFSLERGGNSIIIFSLPFCCLLAVIRSNDSGDKFMNNANFCRLSKMRNCIKEKKTNAEKRKKERKKRKKERKERK